MCVRSAVTLDWFPNSHPACSQYRHWHVFLKWNQKLFNENYLAYKMGRGDKDPSEAWYRGELGFFDFYIIPLAKKLQDCGVFGVSSDEYLNYAVANRREWEIKGKKIVEQYLADYDENADFIENAALGVSKPPSDPNLFEHE